MYENRFASVMYRWMGRQIVLIHFFPSILLFIDYPGFELSGKRILRSFICSILFIGIFYCTLATFRTK